MKIYKSKKDNKPKRKLKIIAIASATLILISLCAFIGYQFGYVDYNLTKPLKVDSFYSNWMSYVKDETKITEVVIPGSHDAGTNKMMPQAMTQGHDIKYQLRGGVRYFDLRVTKKNDDLVIYHGPIKGQKFSKVLNEINDFIIKYPSEFLILDFQHLGENANLSVIQMIDSLLPKERMLYSQDDLKINEITFKELRENKLNYMITWTSKNEEEVNEAKINHYFSRDEYLLSQYNGSKHKESNEALISEFTNYYNLYDPNKLFVLQAQRTAKTLLGKPSDYENSFNNDVTNFIIDIKNDESLLNNTNIIMRDFIVSDINKVNTILELNVAKNLIKDEFILSYKDFIKLK